MRTSSRSLILFAGSVLVASCRGTDASAPSDTPVDIGAAIAQMASASAGGFPGARGMMGIPVGVGGPIVIPSACIYSPAVQGFVCPTTNVVAMTFSLSFFLADATGHPQSQLDSKSTASIRTVVDASGTVYAPSGPGNGLTVVIGDHEDMTMSGLLTTLRTLNGTGKSHYVVTTTGTTTTHSTMDLTSATSNVVIPASGADGSAWPKSGTITSDLKTVSQVGSLPSVSITVHSVVTFNGTSIVTMTMTVSGVTTTCKIDLSGKTAPVC